MREVDQLTVPRPITLDAIFAGTANMPEPRDQFLTIPRSAQSSFVPLHNRPIWHNWLAHRNDLVKLSALLTNDHSA